VIIEDERAIGGKLLENAECTRFAAHWDLRIRACRPYRAKTKGKVERPIGYVRERSLNANDLLASWNRYFLERWLFSIEEPMRRRLGFDRKEQR